MKTPPLLVALALVVGAQQTPSATQDNSGIAATFEDGGLDGWTPRIGCSLANTTADAHSGSHSLLIAGRAADYDGPQIGVSNKMYTGSTYSIGVWVKLAPSATQSDTLRVSLQVTLAGATAYYTVVNNTPVPLGTWVNLSVPTFLMAYTYDPGQAYLYVESNSGTQSFYIDDFQLTYWTPLRAATTQLALKAGTAADYAYLNQSDYTTVLGREYNVLQPENDMKWAAIHPNPPGSPNEYNFVPGDGLVAFAQAHAMQTRGHNLLWYSYNPAWLTNGNYTAAQLFTILQNHITTVVSHYKGQVFAWDVINEAIDDTTNQLRNSIWYNQPGIGLSGNGYIVQAFQWAHQADANALLFWNEYGVEDAGWAKSTAFYNMAKALLAQGVPIGGVGLQMHIATNPSSPSVAGLDANIARFTALGLQVQITEMDVRLPVNQSGVASSADLQTQAQRYRDIAAVCLKYPGCTLFQTWGFSDRYSWIPSFYSGYGAALPFDSNYLPKPAYTSLQQLFTTAPPANSSIVKVNTSWGGTDIAQNTFIEVKGTNLVPATTPAAGVIWSSAPDFASGRMPANLNGVSVTVNGKPAFVYFYCSAVTSTACAANQIDVLTPLDNTIGPVPVTVTSGTTVSTTFTANMKAVVPTFLLFNASGPVVATHADYSLLGAATLYPGYSTPAKPGETVLVYAIGFGLPVNPLTNGSSSQSGSLPSLPACQVGGAPASVIATLISPGLYQLNLTIPSTAQSGNNSISCTYNGAATPSGDIISVQ